MPKKAKPKKVTKHKNNGEVYLKIGDKVPVCYDCGKPFITGKMKKDRFITDDNKNNEPIASYTQDEHGIWNVKYRHFGCEGMSPKQRGRITERSKKVVDRIRACMVTGTQHLSWWEKDALQERINGG